eukprot:904509-Prymnesium_polylepis.1
MDSRLLSWSRLSSERCWRLRSQSARLQHSGGGTVRRQRSNGVPARIRISAASTLVVDATFARGAAHHSSRWIWDIREVGIGWHHRVADGRCCRQRRYR